MGANETRVKSRRAAKAYAEACGHKMDRWDIYDACECERCGAVLVESDAVAFVAGSAVFYLGSLGMPCPHGAAE